MSTTADLAFSTAVRNSSRYFASVDGKIGLHGSILCTLNFSATWAAKSLSSISCDAGTGLGVLPSQPFHPTINSRNGYAATATRSRAAVGNLTAGPTPVANAKWGNKDAPATAAAQCPANSLLVIR